MKLILNYLFLIGLCALAFQSNAQIDSYFFGVYEENENIPEGVSIGGADKNANYYLWNGFKDAESEPFAGDNVISYICDPATWNGFGIHALEGETTDLTEFYDGFLHIAMKTVTTDAAFRVGFKATVDEAEVDWVVHFKPGEDPYEFLRGEEWQEILIPIADFAILVEGAVTETRPIEQEDLETISIYFYMVGNVDINFDEIYFAQGTELPENMAVGVTQELSASTLMYPNPANNILQFRNVKDNSEITILDVTGRIAIKGKVRDGSLNISELNQGIYLARINDGTSILTKQFIKN